MSLSTRDQNALAKIGAKLITSTNTKTAERRIRGAFSRYHRIRHFATHYEHGQWWITVATEEGDLIFSAVDATGPHSENGIGFEPIN